MEQQNLKPIYEQHPAVYTYWLTVTKQHKKGEFHFHFFTTERMDDLTKFLELRNEILAKFPAPDYKVSCFKQNAIYESMED